MPTCAKTCGRLGSGTLHARQPMRWPGRSAHSRISPNAPATTAPPTQRTMVWPSTSVSTVIGPSWNSRPSPVTVNTPNQKVALAIAMTRAISGPSSPAAA